MHNWDLGPGSALHDQVSEDFLSEHFHSGARLFQCLERSLPCGNLTPRQIISQHTFSGLLKRT